MNIHFEYSTETGIKACKITADNDGEAQHLMEARDKIIAIFGSSAAVVVTEENLVSGGDQGDPEEATELFATGGC